MGTYTVYRLKFKTQLHLGRYIGPAQTGSLGLQKTEVYIPADTLFSAICQMWATFYNTKSLTNFLNQYTPEAESLPFKLTSAFPFAKDVCLFPQPMTWTDESKSKESKSIQFVSDNIFRKIIAGNPPKFDKKQLMTSEKVWITDDEKNQLKSPDGEDFNIWTTSTRPRVTIGSRNSGSEIWHVQTVQFNRCCGLWFAAKFDSDRTKQKIETLLRVLGDCGIGGERNAGYGLFDFDNVTTIDLPESVAGNPFVTLSPICPQSETQLEQMLSNDNISYVLSPSTGRISSVGSGDRRKRVNLFTEGSVLNTPNARIGRLIDLKPKEDYPHSVYRYGYAWQVGVKGAANETEV